MQEYSKQAITIEEQIEKLQKRGLKLSDKAFAAEALSNISYYRLRAYTYPYQDNTDPNHPFIKDISFEEIIKLYKFDSKLRLLIFEATEKIEVSLRTQITYHMSINHGSHWYLDAKHFRNKRNFYLHQELISKEISRSKEVFIKHYKKKYASPELPPAWMTLEVLSMGLLSKLFQNLYNKAEKKAILKHFGIKNVDVLENWIYCFVSLRNICAHHSRIWNRRLPKISKPRVIQGTFLNNLDVMPNKLYLTLSAMIYTLNRVCPDHTLLDDLIALIDEYKHLLDIVADMGFPDNWREEALWQK